jgi:preprotein translocase subunit SecF
MYIISHRNIFFAISGLAAAIAIGFLVAFGLQIGNDFTGGTLAEVAYPEERPAPMLVQEALDAAGLTGYSLREAGERNYILRAGNVAPELRASLPELLSGGDAYRGVITQLTEVGPTIGAELRNKAVTAILMVLACILFFIAFAFRKVSEPVSSWLYGFIALATLAFDVLIPVGAFALFGHLWGAQVDALFVTAILTILGYSVHDTIVVFDRTRENLRINHEKGRKEPFEETAGRSLGQTFVRSMNTSVTTLVALLVLYFVGPESTKDFALTLFVGIVAGTYSSIFFATPLLVAVEKWRSARK